jgi:phthiocerol/phenolphthiocerol synthesis type-I polyketide synthase E
MEPDVQAAEDFGDLAIAVVGMAGRFPQADNVARFWQNLEAGRDCVSFFSPDELRASGVPEELIANPRYVPARAVLEDTSGFDAAFFGITAREAEVMDPQQRLLLECAWEALEDAGYPPGSCPMPVGVFAGASSNWYVLNVWSNPSLVEALGETAISLGTDRDHLATRIAYKLNLRGPCFNVQSACSTSLLAVHLACQSLLAGECDMALAGGASVGVRQRVGYLAYEGGTGSRAGRTAAFDAAADGTLGGSGVGLVALKRLDDALRCGDFIHAVIRASAANNDGSAKIGYTAPSVEGQAEVIARALESAGVPGSSITYVEAHGTGTALGDPIEIAALTQAFRGSTADTGFCAIGSVKTNIGHLDSAAGIAGLIKAVLMVREGRLVPSLHYHRPNPHIDFASSPFYVNTEARDWLPEVGPRRAGVSSFGLGGTNVHVVLEEAPAPPERPAGRGPFLLVASARTRTALAGAGRRLEEHLRQHPEVALEDLAYTLQVGREPLRYRWSMVCSDVQEAVHELVAAGSLSDLATEPAERPSLCFLFPGLGCQRPGVATELYGSEPVYQDAIDTCCAILRPALGFDLRELLVDGWSAPRRQPPEAIYEGWIGQPAVFTLEYALAQLLMAWGLQPGAMLGHSLGEYVAACLSGVLSLSDALLLVAERSRLMDQTPPGSMLTVLAGEHAVRPLLAEGASIAIVNTSGHCVVAGATPVVDETEAALAAHGIDSRRLRVSRAFHSPAMEPVLEPFSRVMARTVLGAPQIPYLSNVTGGWIDDRQACDPQYWLRHLREPVRFADGLDQLLTLETPVLLEVGPTQALSGLVRDVASGGATIVSALPAARDAMPQRAHLLRAVGRLWEAGVEVDWEALHAGSAPRRVPAPTYAWDSVRYWAVARPMAAAHPGSGLGFATLAPAGPLAGEPSDTATETAELDASSGLGELERELAAIWKQMLGVRTVRAGDSFLSLGGDSLLSLQLTSRLNQKYAVNLSLHDVLEARTLAGLAALLGHRPAGDETSTGERDPLVVELEPGAGEAPVFLLHAVGGSIFSYAPLVERLRDGQQILGIQPQGFDGSSPLLTTVQAMATRYVQAIRSVQPRGPYYLAGASFGGTLAYEVACQMRAAQDDVALLAMIDTPGPGTPLPPITSSADVLVELFGKQLALDRETLAALDLAMQIDYVVDAAARAGMPLPDVQRETAERRIDLWRTNYQAMLEYVPSPYPGRAVFFRAKEQPAGSLPERSWIELATGGLEIQIVPGDHQSMMVPPCVAELAERLRGSVRVARVTTLPRGGTVEPDPREILSH